MRVDSNKFIKDFLKNSLFLLIIFSLASCGKITPTEELNPENFCTTADIQTYQELHQDQNKNKNLIILPIHYSHQQTEDYTCGPSAVVTLLNYYQKIAKKNLNKSTEMQISQEMQSSPRVGTNPKQIIRWLETHGFAVKSGENGTIDMLKHNLQRGIPTIVEWIDWGGHWVLVIGYLSDAKRGDKIIFADPAAHWSNHCDLTVFDADRFQSMWFDAKYFHPGHLTKNIYITAVPR
jgi:hypothetical protein